MKKKSGIVGLLALLLLYCAAFVFSASASAANGYELTVVNRCGDEARFQKAVELFNAKYPNVRVEERFIDDPRVIATEIMAGAEGIDLLGIQDSFMTISASMLLKNGALADLNRYPELVKLKDDCLDIFGYVTIDGRWYAVPETAEVHLFEVNTDLAGQLCWQLPGGRWSISEFMELARRVKQWNEGAERHIYLLQEDTFLMPWFFHEFQANHVDIFGGKADYDSEEYIELLKMYKWLNDNDLVCKSYTSIKPEMRSDALFFSNRFAGPELLGEGSFILPPSETDVSKYPVYGCLLSLNANTPHMDEAVYFLYCYMSREALELQNGLSWGYWLKDGELTQFAYSFTSISAENIALWNTVLENSCPELYIYDISREQYKTLFPALLDGEISAERFAAISRRMADMALGE